MGYFEMDTELSFGKHRGETIGTVIREDPSYIRWMIDENVGTFSDEVINHFCDAEMEDNTPDWADFHDSF